VTDELQDLWVNDISLPIWPEGALEIMMRVVPTDEKSPPYSIPWNIEQSPVVMSGKANRQ
jgi:hypothetical protein